MVVRFWICHEDSSEVAAVGAAVYLLFLRKRSPEGNG
jgi:hypothetical protein